VNFLGFIIGWLGGLFGANKGDGSSVGRQWWLDPDRKTKSRLAQHYRVMKGGYGVPIHNAKRLTMRQQQRAARCWKHGEEMDACKRVQAVRERLAKEAA
jgi:hypothetical protein